MASELMHPNREASSNVAAHARKQGDAEVCDTVASEKDGFMSETMI